MLQSSADKVLSKMFDLYTSCWYSKIWSPRVSGLVPLMLPKKRVLGASEYHWARLSVDVSGRSFLILRRAIFDPKFMGLVSPPSGSAARGFACFLMIPVVGRTGCSCLVLSCHSPPSKVTSNATGSVRARRMGPGVPDVC